MDPNIPASQGGISTTPTTPSTFNPPAMPVSQDPVPNPLSPPVQLPVNSPSIPPPPPASQTPLPELPKKSSPLFVIALIILLMTVLALGGYYAWTKYLNPQASVPIATNTPVVTPVVLPTEEPSSSPSATPFVEASPSATSSPSGTISR